MGSIRARSEQGLGSYQIVGQLVTPITPRAAWALTVHGGSRPLAPLPSVLVDSEPEVSVAAYTVARDYWPEAFQGATGQQQEAVLQVRGASVTS